MPRISDDEASFSKLLRQFKKEAKCFAAVSTDVLSANPRFIRVFRMALGLGLEEMASLLDKTYATISQYERGNIRAIPRTETGKFLRALKKELPQKISFEETLENFKSFREKSRGGLLKGLRRAELGSETKQEQKVREVLEKSQMRYEAHKTIDTKIGPLNYDFVVNGSTVMECTTALNKMKAEALSYRVIKLRERFPKMKAIAVVSRAVSKGFLRRLSDFDHVVFDDEVYRLQFLLAPHAAVQLDSSPGTLPRATAV